MWYQQQDMLSKFLRRSAKIEPICPSQFARMFTTFGLKMKKRGFEAEDKDQDESNQEESMDDVNNSDYDLNKRKFHFIMTDNDDMIPLPKVIEINDPYPGEPKYMRKRKGPAVLRFHKNSKDNQFEKWMLNELMLYTPFREADLDEYENNTAEVYKQKENWIRIVKSKVMEHLEDVEEARYMVEQANIELDLEDIGIQMDAAHAQDQANCKDEEILVIDTQI